MDLKRAWAFFFLRITRRFRSLVNHGEYVDLLYFTNGTKLGNTGIKSMR